MLGWSKAPPMAKQKAKSGTLASRESYVEYSRPSNTSTKTTVDISQWKRWSNRWGTLMAEETSMKLFMKLMETILSEQLSLRRFFLFVSHCFSDVIWLENWIYLHTVLASTLTTNIRYLKRFACLRKKAQLYVLIKLNMQPWKNIVAWLQIGCNSFS